MIGVLLFVGAVFLVFWVTAVICDRMDAHDELKHNEYVARCRAFHPTIHHPGRWE